MQPELKRDLFCSLTKQGVSVTQHLLPNLDSSLLHRANTGSRQHQFIYSDVSFIHYARGSRLHTVLTKQLGDVTRRHGTTRRWNQGVDSIPDSLVSSLTSKPCFVW